MRRLLLATVLVLALGGGGVVAFSRWDADADTDGGSEDAATTDLVEVGRRTLVDAERISGDLGYDDARSVSADRADGVLTWLPEEGRTLRAGDVAYRVDQEPVVVLVGAIPLYRELSDGVDDGADVRQLERNLKRLGHDPGTVDTEFTDATEEAVEELQADHGLEETGVVTGADFVVLPEAIRVGAVRTDVGATLVPGAATVLYDATSTRKVVTADVDPSDESLVEVGRRATVTLPDGSELRAEVSEVGTVATATDTESPEASADATLPVTFTLLDTKGTRGLTAAPVTVDVTRQRQKDVLAVPVTALVALAEGGFAVRREGGALVAVETGLYSDGHVEITSGLAEGDRVEVPAG